MLFSIFVSHLYKGVTRFSPHLPNDAAVQRAINGFTTAIAVLHQITLIIKDGSLRRRGSDHLVQSRGN